MRTAVVRYPTLARKQGVVWVGGFLFQMEILGEGWLLVRCGFHVQGLASTRSCSRKFGRDGTQQSPNHLAGWKLKSVALTALSSGMPVEG